MIHPLFSEILGVILLLTGLAIRYKIAQRKFYRRGPAGLEWFSSYRRAVLVRFAEGLAGIFAKIFILMGILLILAGTLNK
jgi:hypothetical protein